MSEINLTDIPDLTGVDDTQETAPWSDGWYEGTILERREFTDKNGNDRVFESADAPAASGESRNIRLQVQLKRQADGREMNVSTLVNYRPEDLTHQTVSQVIAQREKVKEGAEWGSLFRPFATLQRLGKLQKIAGVRQFAKNGNGLDLHVLYGKKAYFRIANDDRNPQYKAITDFRADAPKRNPVL